MWIPAALLFLAAASAPPATLSVDLDGDGRLETIRAERARGRIRITVRDPRGRKVTTAFAPAPASGVSDVALAAGSLGSAGSLVEVTAGSPTQTCRSLWRLRSGKLDSLPVQRPGGPLPACAAAEGWTTRFEPEAEGAPALYLRERTRSTPRGAHRETQAFQFSGFQLDFLRARGEIDGVAIPDWYDAVLYPRSAVEALFERFDLTPLRTLPRLSIDADASRGAFSLRFHEPGGETVLPVRASAPAPESGVSLKVDAPKGPLEILVRVTKDVPFEVLVVGLSDRLDHLYVPVARVQDGAFHVYPNAAAELSANGLPGTWGSDARETVTIAAAPGALDRIRFDQESFSVDVDRAPEGLDVLLVPEREKAPSWALDLRGPHALLRVPVRCSAWPSPAVCEGSGPGVTLRRLGARINLR